MRLAVLMDHTAGIRVHCCEVYWLLEHVLQDRRVGGHCQGGCASQPNQTGFIIGHRKFLFLY